MDEGPTIEQKSTLKHEWNLFWETILGDSPGLEEDFDSNNRDFLNPEKLRNLRRELSQQRRDLNSKMETLNRKIEDIQIKLESVRLVGGDEISVLRELSDLNDLGQKYSLELEKIDQKIKASRELESELPPALVAK